MPKRDLKYLIVNDDLLVCLVVGQLIRHCDPESIIAIKNNGKTALKYLCEVLVDSTLKQPDVILLDISMPVMDGIEFLEGFSRLGKNHKNIFVYILSATAKSQISNIPIQYPFVRDIFELPLQKETVCNLQREVESFLNRNQQ